MRHNEALYLCACNGHGWTPSEKGFEAFCRQMENGLRHEDGRMYWMGD